MFSKNKLFLFGFKPLFFVISFLAFFISTIDAKVKFRGKSSAITINPGANFVSSSPLSGIQGAIANAGGTISGSNMTFSNGILQDANGK